MLKKSLTCLVLGIFVAFLGSINAQCEVLVPENCLLPFPSNYYLKPDNSTPSGNRLFFPDETAPVDRSGDTFSMSVYSRLDGYSKNTAMMAYFPDVSTQNVAGWWEIGKSLEPNHPTLLLNTRTGEFLAHYGELDYTTPDSNNKAFMMWATEELDENTRYIVAMRNLVDSNGNAVAPSESFRILRDRVATEDPAIEERRADLEDIFSVLDANGIERSTLQLAWDFTTGSDEKVTGYLIHVREDSKRRHPESGPEYIIDNIQDDLNDEIYRKIEGRMIAPHYLTRNALPGSVLVLDEETELPVFQGMTEVPFTILIPRVCVDPSSGMAPCPYQLYGHGLLGTRSQVESGTQRRVSNTEGYILAAVDMWGMSSPDVPFISGALLTDLSDLIVVPDRSIQGLLNHLLLARMLKGPIVNDDIFQFNGQSVIDPSRSLYWGISQGGILGAVVVAASEDMHLGQLGVPGAPYPLLLARSVDFDPFFYIIKARYSDSNDRILILSFLGLLWDIAEPSGFMSHLAPGNQLPGITAEKRVIIDYSKGDAQVTYLGAYHMARTMDAKVFTNNVICHNETDPIYGFEYVDGSTNEGSMMVGFDYDIGCGPFENIPPPKETDTHSMGRNDPRNQAMAGLFFSTGEIRDFCNGEGCYSDNLIRSYEMSDEELSKIQLEKQVRQIVEEWELKQQN